LLRFLEKIQVPWPGELILLKRCTYINANQSRADVAAPPSELLNLLEGNVGGAIDVSLDSRDS
jgi:hypothetical protein